MASEVSYLAALLAGVVSFLSPCVLPLVPAYLSYVAGTTAESGGAVALAGGPRHAPGLRSTGGALPASLAFVAGFTVVFVSLGATASALSGLLFDYRELLGVLAGLVIILFGLHYLGLFRKLGVMLLDRDVRAHAAPAWGGIGGAFLVGIAFAFGWTPCIGPMLATILTLAGSSDLLSFGTSLLAVYSLGLGVPFVLAALALRQFLAFSRGFRRYLPAVEVGSGVILLVVGFLILQDNVDVNLLPFLPFRLSFSALGYYLLEMFPVLGRMG
ncbi:MAG: cytochrome c biogenesis protein CcdA [Alphaproteobacteria bacterium]|nr:cytochrome c biogenesis protein CcdA [Alphaproteobacteria bacterium]